MRRGLLAVCVAAMTLLSGGVANAEVSAAPNSDDLTHAQRIARELVADGTVARFMAGGDASRAGRFHPTLTEGVATVYELSPEFVTGRSREPGRFSYLAVLARSGPDAAMVFSVRDDNGGWTAGGVSSGDTESRLTQELPAGTRLLLEPQIQAWYAVDERSVRPLAGGAAMSIGDYQRLVAGRYADKMAGSAYDQAGMAGGFPADTPVPAGGTPGFDGGVMVFTLGLSVLVACAFAWRSRRA